MSRRPRTNLASSKSAGGEPSRVQIPAPGKRARTAAYRDVAPAEEAQPGRPGGPGAARPLNLDYPILPPAVFGREEAEGAVSRASTSAGQPLPEELAARFSASLGADLSGVRIHTGAASASAARAVGARAYALGQDVHFAAGQYDPASTAGQHLLAHEVAHTVQQAGGSEVRQNKLEVSSPGDAHEAEADRAAEAMVAGEATSITTSTHGGVSRFWDEVSEFLWGEEEVATKTPYQPPSQPSSQPSPQPSSQPSYNAEADIEVQRAEQDLAISQSQLAAAQQADAAARANLDQSKAALDAAREQHAQAASDGAAGIPGTAANGRLAAAEQRTRAAESAVEVATRTAERCAQELRDAEANERVMYANLEEAKRNAAAGGQAGNQAGGEESASFWDAFGW